MEAPKGLSLTLLVTTTMAMLLMIPSTSQCGASGTISLNTHGTNTSVNDDSLSAYQDVELEFQMDSEIRARYMISFSTRTLVEVFTKINHHFVVVMVDRETATAHPVAQKYEKLVILMHLNAQAASASEKGSHLQPR